MRECAPSRIEPEWRSPVSESSGSFSRTVRAIPDAVQDGRTGALEGAELLVTVRDEGTGMAPRIDSPGLGLGLPLIAQTAHSLEVRQAPTGGTEMRMSFRLAD